jgi:hypothetical protein
VHPFHPLSGRELPLVCERRSRHGERVWLQEADGPVITLPRKWTSLWVPDAFELASAGRTCFRADDLARLVELVAAIRKRVEDQSDKGEGGVKCIMP